MNTLFPNKHFPGDGYLARVSDVPIYLFKSAHKGMHGSQAILDAAHQPLESHPLAAVPRGCGERDSDICGDHARLPAAMRCPLRT